MAEEHGARGYEESFSKFLVRSSQLQDLRANSAAPSWSQQQVTSTTPWRDARDFVASLLANNKSLSNLPPPSDSCCVVVHKGRLSRVPKSTQYKLLCVQNNIPKNLAECPLVYGRHVLTGPRDWGVGASEKASHAY